MTTLVTPGSSQTQHPPASAAPPPGTPGTLRPTGAEVFIDGRRAGPADPPGASRTLFALPPGMHRVEIVRGGFRPLRTEIRIASRVTFAIRGKLEPK